ncbi:hypothetical protein [Ectobacillus panaciterrae]|nr:hypothetical protein [Ectobacillus panaciterrae]
MPFYQFPLGNSLNCFKITAAIEVIIHLAFYEGWPKVSSVFTVAKEILSH